MRGLSECTSTALSDATVGGGDRVGHPSTCTN